MRIASGGRQGHEPVYGITTAEHGHTEDVARRQKQYILTMLFRVVSVVVVVWVPGISWPLKIVLILVATIIPYVAVVRANGGPSADRDPTNLVGASPPQGVEGGGSALPDGGPAGAAADNGTDSDNPDEQNQYPENGANSH